MKPVTKKILEAGLVDKHAAAMLTRWGMLEVGEAGQTGIKKITAEQLEQFAEELDELVDREEETMRETPLDMSVGPTEAFVCENTSEKFVGRWDPMGRLVSYPVLKLKRGMKITQYAGPKELRVLDITHLYRGNEISFFLITVEGW